MLHSDFGTAGSDTFIFNAPPAPAARGPVRPAPEAPAIAAARPGDWSAPAAPAETLHLGTILDDDIEATDGANLVLALSGNDTIRIDSASGNQTGLFSGGKGDDSFVVEVTGVPTTEQPAHMVLLGGAGEDSFDIYFEFPESSDTPGALPAAPLILGYEAGEQITLHSFFVYYGGMAYVSGYELEYSEDHDITYVVAIPDFDYYGPPGPYTPEPAVVMGLAGEWSDDNGLNIDFHVDLGL